MKSKAAGVGKGRFKNRVLIILIAITIIIASLYVLVLGCDWLSNYSAGLVIGPVILYVVLSGVGASAFIIGISVVLLYAYFY